MYRHTPTKDRLLLKHIQFGFGLSVLYVVSNVDILHEFYETKELLPHQLQVGLPCGPAARNYQSSVSERDLINEIIFCACVAGVGWTRLLRGTRDNAN
jgi:hypothetical protein